MARVYDFHGRFKIKTTCSDLEKISKALNETARQFADILDFNLRAEGLENPPRGYMWIYSDVELDIPVNEPIEDYEEEEEEAEVDDDDQTA
jgi:hypothetical protein